MVLKSQIKVIIAVIRGIVLLLIIFIVAMGILGFTIVNKQKKAEFYSLGNDKIATIAKVVDVRDVVKISTETSGGVITKNIKYKSDSSDTDITKYISYLIENEGFITTTLNDDKEGIVLGKESVDTGEIILVDVKMNEQGYTLFLIKGKGTLRVK